ncbi:hypothetical protein DITRI_Ditri18aG0104600 [Diplodiscus trichospermus]
MDEIWERAVETALDGHADHAAARTLTLDGAVKCVQGRLPPPSLLEKFENLQHLSIANIGLSSLESFPRLRNLQKLILSDNRISGGLEFLVEAGLESLRDLDLSNNRIQYIEDLAPLAQIKLVSLDLYECPVTRVKDYRSRVFGLIPSLKHLDKMDAEGNERPESDDEEEDEEDDDEDDPGSGEIDGEDRPYRMDNGHSEGGEGIVDVDEDEESDADEEETETGRTVNGQSHEANGFRIEEVARDEDEDDDEEENDSGEEVDDDDEEDDVVEVHEIGDSDDEEDGVDDDEDDDDDDDEDDEEEEVDNDEGDFAEPESTGRLTSTEGEIDGHEHGEDDGDDDDNNGETGEEEQGVEDDGEFEDEGEGEEEEEEAEDYGEGYLVQPVGQAEEHDAGGIDMDPGNEEDDGEEEEEEVEDEEEVQALPSSSQLKRKRSDDTEENEDDEEKDDVVEFAKSSKKHR